jgi:hypothetical protein
MLFPLIRSEHNDLCGRDRTVGLDVQVAVTLYPGDSPGQGRLDGNLYGDPAVQARLERITAVGHIADDAITLQSEIDRFGVRPEQQCRPLSVEILGQVSSLPHQVITQTAHIRQQWPEKLTPFTAAEKFYLGPQMVNHALALLRSDMIAIRRVGEFP